MLRQDEPDRDDSNVVKSITCQDCDWAEQPMWCGSQWCGLHTQRKIAGRDSRSRPCADFLPLVDPRRPWVERYAAKRKGGKGADRER